jgi:hypothetical protein
MREPEIEVLLYSDAWTPRDASCGEASDSEMNSGFFECVSAGTVVRVEGSEGSDARRRVAAKWFGGGGTISDCVCDFVKVGGSNCNVGCFQTEAR